MKINNYYSKSVFTKQSPSFQKEINHEDKVKVLKNLSIYSFVPALLTYPAKNSSIKPIAAIGAASDIAYIALNTKNATKKTDTNNISTNTKFTSIGNIFEGLAFTSIHTALITTNTESLKKNKKINIGLSTICIASLILGDYFKHCANKKNEITKKTNPKKGLPKS